MEQATIAQAPASAPRCQYLVDDPRGAHRCDRTAVIAYIDPERGGKTYPLCTRHDTERAYVLAADLRLRRVELGASS